MVAVVALSAGLVGAYDDTYWQHDPATPGNWFDDANWTLGVPEYNMRSYVDNGGTARIEAGDAQGIYIFIGNAGSGAIEQTGGTLGTGETYLRLGVEPGASGTYRLIGGSLTPRGTVIGWDGNGLLEQSGGQMSVSGSNYASDWEYIYTIGACDGSSGTVRISGGTQEVYTHFVLGYHHGATGRLELSGTGELHSRWPISVGRYGVARVVQTSGLLTTDLAGAPDYSIIGVGDFPASLYFGPSVDGLGEGTYELNGGELRTLELRVGSGGGTGTFIQAGGAVTTERVKIHQNGEYFYTGGALDFGKMLLSEGRFDLDSSSVTLSVPAGTNLMLGRGTVTRSQNASLVVPANTLAVFPEGFDPDTDLAGYAVDGVLHVQGGSLVVPSERSFVALGEIDDLVHCHGAIGHSEDYNYVPHLRGGIMVFPGGTADLGGVGSITDGIVSVDNIDSGNAGGTLHAEVLRVGYEGVGRFVHSSGTCDVGTLVVGDKPTGDGTYELSGDAQLYARGATIGKEGTGRLVQTGGTFTVRDRHLRVGYERDSQGVYELHGGQLSVGLYYGLFIGAGESTGRFLQTGGLLQADLVQVGGSSSLVLGSAELEITGGTAEVGALSVADPTKAHVIQRGGSLTVGALIVGHLISNAGEGRYELIDGTITADETILGENHIAGLFIQTGGTHQPGKLIMDALARYEYAGGQLLVGDLLIMDGEFDFQGSAVSLEAQPGSFWDFRWGNLLNTSSASVTAGPNSLLTFPAGFDPSVAFAGFENQGVTYESGQTLVIPPGFSIRASAEDARAITDYVECAGSLAARDEGDLHLDGGLHVSAGGSVQLGDEGRLYVDNLVSGLTDGTLVAPEQRIGNVGVGIFTQIGGSNEAGQLLIGHEPGASGTYVLEGNGQLRTERTLSVGYQGLGTFIHESGDVTTRGLILADEEGSEGVYEMRGGRLNTAGATIGRRGPAVFRQTGGTVSDSGELNIPRGAGVSGTYELSNGLLNVEDLIIGSAGDGSFVQTGGLVSCPTSDEENGIYVGKGLYGSVGSGSYELSGHGVIRAGRMYVGDGMPGQLTINSTDAGITISDRLYFGPQAGLQAVADAVIIMSDDSSLANESTDPVALAGLANLTLVCELGVDANAFEVAGEDRGPAMEGLVDNFALDRLIVLGGGLGGTFLLFDNFDNRPAWEGPEAVYVKTLLIGPGACLDLNGLNLYYLNGGAPKQFFPGDANLDGCVDVGDFILWADHYRQSGMAWDCGDFNGDGLVDGADWTLWADSYGAGAGLSPAAAVPEPAGALLLVLAGWALGRRRRARGPGRRPEF